MFASEDVHTCDGVTGATAVSLASTPDTIKPGTGDRPRFCVSRSEVLAVISFYGAAVDTVSAARIARCTPWLPVSVMVMLTRVCPTKVTGSW